MLKYSSASLLGLVIGVINHWRRGYPESPKLIRIKESFVCIINKISDNIIGYLINKNHCNCVHVVL